jgi:hypothetical protein
MPQQDFDAAALMSWDADVEISPDRYARMRAHPRYPDAVRRFARNMLRAGESAPDLDGILKDAGRNVAALCAAYLDSSGGLTLPSLKALIAGFGLVSPGRARALLIYLVYLRFVELKPVREHGKPAVYRPTVRFQATYRAHLRAVMDAAQVLEPAVGLLLDRFDAPGVYETFVRQMGDGFLAATRVSHDYEVYQRVIMHRYAGIQIMHALLADSAEAVFPPMQPMPFSASSVARRFKVSRVHVRRLIEAAQAEQLLTWSEGAVTFAPKGRNAVDWAYATQMILFLTAAARTLKALPALAEPDAERAA